MHDAWAAYDTRAVGTPLAGVLRHPAAERTLANKQQTISYAAYCALADVLPADIDSVYEPLMRALRYDPDGHSKDIKTPAGVGKIPCPSRQDGVGLPSGLPNHVTGGGPSSSLV